MFCDRPNSADDQGKAPVSKRARDTLTIDPRVPKTEGIHLTGDKRDLLGRRPTYQVEYHEPVLVLAELGSKAGAGRLSPEVALPGQILFPIYRDRQLVGYLDLKKLTRNHSEDIISKWFTHTREAPLIYTATNPEQQVVSLRQALLAASHFISLTVSVCPTDYAAQPLGIFFENLPLENNQSPNALLFSAYLLATQSKLRTAPSLALSFDHLDQEYLGLVFSSVNDLRQRLLGLNRSEGIAPGAAAELFTPLFRRFGDIPPIALGAISDLDQLRDGQRITPYRLFAGYYGSIDPTFTDLIRPSQLPAWADLSTKTGFFLRVHRQDGLWFAAVTAEGLSPSSIDLLSSSQDETQGVRVRRLVFSFPTEDLVQDNFAVSAKQLLERIVSSSDAVEVTSPVLSGAAIRVRFGDINCEIRLRLASQDNSAMVLMPLDGILQARPTKVKSEALNIRLEVGVFPIISETEEALPLSQPSTSRRSAIIPALFLPGDLKQLDELTQIIKDALSEQAPATSSVTTPTLFDASVQT